MTFILIALFLVGALWITAIIVLCLYGVYEYIKNKKIKNIALKNSGYNNMQEYLEKSMDVTICDCI